MKEVFSHRLLRPVALLAAVFPSVVLRAVTVSDGGVNYSLTAQALADMTDEVVLTTGYVVSIVYVIASLLAIYNATVIYIKMQNGEQGIMKSIFMLLGAILFLIGATLVLPAFFGYNYGSSGSSPFG